jgi:nuclear transcription Y subunit beta
VIFRRRRASDKCQKEKRKTINGDDLLWAMATLGFEEYVDPLKIYLQKYRDVIMAPAHLFLVHMRIIRFVYPSHLASLFLAIFWTGAVIADGGM